MSLPDTSVSIIDPAALRDEVIVHEDRPPDREVPIMTPSAAQFSDFKKELSYSYEKVPFYRRLLDGCQIRPGDIHSPADLDKLPLTEKRLYRKHFPVGVFAQGFSPRQPMLSRTQSSGTTGERLVTYEVGMLLLQRAIRCAEIYPEVQEAFTRRGRRICRYAAPNCSDVECANPNSSMTDRLLPDGTLVLPVYHDLLTTSPELIERAIGEIIEYQPDLYYVDPTHFAFLLRHFRQRGIQPPAAPVITSYSTATRVSLRQIRAAFPDQPVAELLSSSEMGWIAMSCRHGSLHLNSPSFLFELLEDSGHSGNGAGELCISSLDQGAIPHLRYRTGDLLRPGGQNCACGSERPVVVMEGRTSNVLTTVAGSRLSPRQVDDLLGAPDWLDQYQLHQLDDNRLVLKLMTNEHDHTGAEAALRAALETALPASQIQVERVNYIASERSGKFQFVKSDLQDGQGGWSQ